MIVALEGMFIGLAATVLIDLWAVVLARAFRLPVSNWALVGRWVGHLRHGRWVHRPITASAPIAGERALGWSFHYAIGLLYGIAYLALVHALGRTPSLLSAILFSVALLVMPWLILQPGLGMGVLARRAPRPWRSRAISVSMHVVFGFGLYLGWRLLE